ncbi:hypothetical protein EXIGLDRAFT_757736 [Exidia glandulosa HHB12029]|uniref:Uncharacterized protein n=1 Tax=Exidia glandulosa HHB12029 TaxID=1314781 RepID=A0A166MUJ3_EXIGL|nr:hypothetical protein EXIGLDRAFT_757736 [Exidia glandulosa HHB12029]
MKAWPREPAFLVRRVPAIHRIHSKINQTRSAVAGVSNPRSTIVLSPAAGSWATGSSQRLEGYVAPRTTSQGNIDDRALPEPAMNIASSSPGGRRWGRNEHPRYGRRCRGISNDEGTPSRPRRLRVQCLAVNRNAGLRILASRERLVAGPRGSSSDAVTLLLVAQLRKSSCNLGGVGVLVFAKARCARGGKYGIAHTKSTERGSGRRAQSRVSSTRSRIRTRAVQNAK